MNDTIEDPRIAAAKTKPEEADGQLATSTVVLESLSGAAAGAVLGAVAGPPGAVAGALIGGFAATLAGAVAHTDEVERREHDRELDRAIGVTEGNLGAGLEGVPPTRGFSLAAMGIHGAGRTPAEGPIEDLADD